MLIIDPSSITQPTMAHYNSPEPLSISSADVSLSQQLQSLPTSPASSTSPPSKIQSDHQQSAPSHHSTALPTLIPITQPTIQTSAPTHSTSPATVITQTSTSQPQSITSTSHPQPDLSERKPKTSELESKSPLTSEPPGIPSSNADLLFFQLPSNPPIDPLHPIQDPLPIISPKQPPIPSEDHLLDQSTSRKPSPPTQKISPLIVSRSMGAQAQLGLTTTDGDRPSPSNNAPLNSSVPAPAPDKSISNSTQDLKPTSANNNKKNSDRSSTVSKKKFHFRAWKERLVEIRYYLDQLSIAPKMAATKLVEILTAYETKQQRKCGDKSSVPLDGRLEVILAIKYNRTSNKFLQAWSNSQTESLAVIDSWLRDAVYFLVRQDNPSQLSTDQQPRNRAERTYSQRLMILHSILQLLDKLPISYQHLIKHSFGKQIHRINVTPKFPDNITQLSNLLEPRWREIVQRYKAENPSHEEPSTTTNSTPALPPKNGPPATVNITTSNSNPSTSASTSTSNHQQLSTTTSATATKFPLSNLNPNRPASVQPRKRSLETSFGPDHSNDMKKRKVDPPNQPTGQKQVAGLNARQEPAKSPTFAMLWRSNSTTGDKPTPTPPTVEDAFSQAMGLLKSHLASNPDHNFSDVHVPKSNANKPVKNVRFRSDDELCQVKIVERLVYDDDEDELPRPWMDDARMLDACEGRYLHHALGILEEEMEWTSSREVMVNTETLKNLKISPLVSQAATIQEARGLEIASARHTDESEIPETSSVPTRKSSLSKHPVLPPKQMKLGGELLTDPQVIHAIAWCQAANGADSAVADDQQVSNILAQLAPPNQCSPSPAFNHQPQRPFNPILGSTELNHFHGSNPQQSSLLIENNTPYNFYPDRSDRDLPPHINLPQHPQPSLPAPPPSLTVSSQPKRKRKKKKPKIRLDPDQQGTQDIQCRYGAECQFGQNCRFTEYLSYPDKFKLLEFAPS
ncbi:hypothetical protein PGT21_005551 [Puccinia graminis f. sp. tritici]|uniref:Uncharacterized protein n=1 Tax=Puccinia graminis f. sp. tritici TaxID=56615 RepID=A0A5B0LZE6_PUCGR|nr:hypothetical protein PGT21_005551 [Puccinia graminis f. sp. tritici]